MDSNRVTDAETLEWRQFQKWFAFLSCPFCQMILKIKTRWIETDKKKNKSLGFCVTTTTTNTNEYKNL